jgi:hypothetical protein
MLDGYLKQRRKLRVEDPIVWDHHRGGWKQVVKAIVDNFHCAGGVRFLSAVEQAMATGEVIGEPWVGVVHEVPSHGTHYPDLEAMLEMDAWKANARQCLGLWTLSTYVKNFLQPRLRIPVNIVYYPTDIPEQYFSFRCFEESDPQDVLFIGEYLRRFEDFYQLSAPGFRKILLHHPTLRLEEFASIDDSVYVRNAVSDEEHDLLLSKSVVFLSLADAPTNTTIVECIARHTPVLVNAVGGVTEYLGDDYPFYYDDLEEASRKLMDLNLIAKTVQYLRQLPMRDKITFSHFIESFQNTAIDRSLPTPHSEKTEFPTYDLTLFICSYRRVENINDILQRLSQQDYAGSFETIVWNNNIEAQAAVDSACEPFRSRLNLIVIHSSHNFYCIVRLEAASLMRSELLLICGDDVLPTPAYVSTFVAAQQLHGENGIVCARGHTFLSHVLDEEHPDRVWRLGQHLNFHDEGEDACLLHYMHADNCAIPRRILRKLVQFDMDPEFALVDDYWMSFVISHELRLQIHKVRADEAFSFHQSSVDPQFALVHNALVKEQQVNFYIHHIRRGWPFGIQESEG